MVLVYGPTGVMIPSSNALPSSRGEARSPHARASAWVHRFGMCPCRALRALELNPQEVTLRRLRSAIFVVSCSYVELSGFGYYRHQCGRLALPKSLGASATASCALSGNHRPNAPYSPKADLIQAKAKRRLPKSGASGSSLPTHIDLSSFQRPGSLHSVNN